MAVGEKCTNHTKHAEIQAEIRSRFKKGDRVLYNYWAYERDSPATVVGYCERGKPDGYSYPWAWIRLKFDYLKQARNVPIHSAEGWHLKKQGKVDERDPLPLQSPSGMSNR